MVLIVFKQNCHLSVNISAQSAKRNFTTCQKIDKSKLQTSTESRLFELGFVIVWLCVTRRLFSTAFFRIQNMHASILTSEKKIHRICPSQRQKKRNSHICTYGQGIGVYGVEFVVFSRRKCMQ